MIVEESTSGESTVFEVAALYSTAAREGEVGGSWGYPFGKVEEYK